MLLRQLKFKRCPKNNLALRLIGFICAAAIFLSCTTVFKPVSVNADAPEGKMSAVYGYILNDYLLTYGTLFTAYPGDAYEDDNPVNVTGVVYADIVNFDDNDNPYLVIYLADNAYSVSSCHIWSYNEETEQAERAAVIDKDIRLSRYTLGEMTLGWNNEKRYIGYHEYNSEGSEVYSEYYTMMDGEELMYLSTPDNVQESSIADFNMYRFHPGVDISNGNKNLSNFFDTLKNTAANSVSYNNITERLTDESRKEFETVMKKAVGFKDFDIARYSSREEYETALLSPDNCDTFYLISDAYDLGDKMYYVMFSTNRSYYNYALLRKSDEAENGYQILKVRTDCIPLSDRELRMAKKSYDKNTLLFQKSKSNPELAKKGGSDKKNSNGASKNTGTVINKKFRTSAACMGGGITVALLTFLYVYMFSPSEDEKRLADKT